MQKSTPVLSLISILAFQVFLYGMFAVSERHALAGGSPPFSSDIKQAGKGMHLSDLPKGVQKKISDHLRQAEYAVRRCRKALFSGETGIHRAVNRRQDMNAYFTEKGFHLLPRGKGDPAWHLNMTLTGYGCDGAVTPLQAIPSGKIKVSGNRIENRRKGLTEWYVNDDRGLEQGVTLHRPPAGNGPGPLVVEWAVSGSLVPRLERNRVDIAFCEDNDEKVLRYSGLKAWDATGRILPAKLSVEYHEKQSAQASIAYVVDGTNAVYPVTIDPVFTQEKKLLPMDIDGAENDHFGMSVAVSGDTMVVGALLDDDSGPDSGSAYIFDRNRDGSDTWRQVKKITAGDGAEYDHFGTAVAISGDTVVVGASLDDDSGPDSGSAYIFDRNQGGISHWGEVKKITAGDGATDDLFGCSVAISGDTVVICAERDDENGSSSGSAYIFDRDQGGADNWGEVKKVTAGDGAADDLFGRSVAICDDTAVVGAIGEDENGSASGAAYVFARDNGGPDNWGEVKKITAGDGAPDDYFGWSVAMSGDMAVVGAHSDDDYGSRSGAAYVFARDNGGPDNWGEVKKLTAGDGATDDLFGFSVAMSDHTVVVSAYWDAGKTGSAYVFARDNGGPDNWGEVKKLTAGDGATDDVFGYAVAISGDTVVVGAPGDDDNGSESGSAYVFDRDNGGIDNWGQMKKTIPGSGATGDQFGYAVAISGDTVVVGALFDDDNGADSGSVYIFERCHGGYDNWGQVKKITAGDGDHDDRFGCSVAISGDTLVVGACGNDYSTGAACIFERNHGGADNWGQRKKIIGSDESPSLEYFGYAVAISGDRVVVGACGDDYNSGTAYIYDRDQGGADNWGELQKITGQCDGGCGHDRFGTSVAISDSTIVIGAWGDPDQGGDAGAAYIFEGGYAPPSSWMQTKKITAGDGAADDRFGTSVAISGDTVVVGAWGDDDNGADAGAAYIFDCHYPSSNAWGERKKICAGDGAADDRFGTSVAISGDTVVVGAPLNDALGTGPGAVYNFHRNQDGTHNWGQVQKMTAGDGTAKDAYGGSVAISGDMVAVGASKDDLNGSDSGSGYVLAVDIPAPTVVWVDDDYCSGGANDGHTWLVDAFDNIQFGISAVAALGTVYVADGTYTGPWNRDMDFSGKAITVQSVNGPSVCIIDCQAASGDPHYAFRFDSGEGSDSVLSGFTLTNGYDSNGGAIQCASSSSPAVSNCIFTGNSTDGNGGGLFCTGAASPTITDCTFADNTAAHWGGGIFIEDGSHAVLRNCVFLGNDAGEGGGVFSGGSSTTAVSCVFSGNSSGESAGGFYSFSGDASTLVNCTFSGNSAAYGGGMYAWGYSTPIVKNCIFWGNTGTNGPQIGLTDNATVTLSHCDVQGDQGNIWVFNGGSVTWGTGNIDADPLFLDPDGADATAGTLDDDLHLHSTSPCIDAGDNTAVPSGETVDIDAGTRFYDAPYRLDTGIGTAPIVDMGADEYGAGDGDGDGMDDAWEIQYFTDIESRDGSGDSDSDGLSDLDEFRNGTDPSDTDSDNDTMPDNWEVMNSLNPQVDDTLGDVDGDGFSNLAEYLRGSDPDDSGSLPTVMTIFVDATAAGDENGTLAHPFDTIQEGINYSGPGDTVQVADGTYSGSGNRDMDYNGRAITVQSENGPSTCIIDCQGTSGDPHNAFRFDSGEDSGAVLSGFTITNGYDSNGGAILCDLSSSPVISNCIFINNSADYDGGGISIKGDCNVEIRNCAFLGNHANDDGGGILSEDSNTTAVNCIFSGNTSADKAGGFYSISSDTSTLINCSFSGNHALYGGGMFVWGYSTPTVKNCIFWGNTGTDGSQMGIWDAGPVSISHCNMQGGQSSIHNTASTIAWGDGNMDSDPLFADPDGADGTSGTMDDDLHLLFGSPCIDAGDNGAVPSGLTTDSDDETRFYDDPCTPDTGLGTAPIVDMGPDEYGDGDGDGMADGWETYYFSDLGISDGTGDDDHDGLSDLGEFLNNTYPDDVDSDDDAWYDASEVNQGTDPMNPGDHPAWTFTYVDIDATGVNNGTSWTDAYTDLQTALSAVSGGTRIWVAAGTYCPSAEHGGTGDRYRSFKMMNGVAICGGFAGTEDPGSFDPADRDFSANETILSGDFEETPSDDSDNSYHVIYHAPGDGIHRFAFLDGFTIMQGHADGSGSDSQGGGMYNDLAWPGVYNCAFENNLANEGAGMFNYWCSPDINGCTFSGNHANDSGGGMFLSQSNASVTDCTFIGNTAVSWGGGIFMEDFSHIALRNCAFLGNRADDDGGGFFSNDHSSTTAVNCLFSGNTSADKAGGFYSSTFDTSAMINCTFYGNHATGFGGGIFIRWSATPALKNCILWGNTSPHGPQMWIGNDSEVSIAYCDMQGGLAGISNDDSIVHWGAGNVDRDPLFIDAGGPDGVAGTLDDDLHLFLGSPCIDAGDNESVPSGITMDCDAETRFYDDPYSLDTGLGTAPIVDMGADEYGDGDGDGLADGWELYYFTDIQTSSGNGNDDNDGLTDLEEFQYGTAPNDPDSDSDTMTDGWEVANSLNPLDDDSLQDFDGDGFCNLKEYLSGSDPQNDVNIPECISIDSDTDVDGSDAAVIADEFDRTDCGPEDPCRGDIDKDGDVDAIDLFLFSEDYGREAYP